MTILEMSHIPNVQIQHKNKKGHREILNHKTIKNINALFKNQWK